MNKKHFSFQNSIESDTDGPTLESYLLETLRRLRLDYEQAAKPYVDRLVRIKAMQSPSLVMAIDPAALDQPEPVAEATWDGTLRWIEPYGIGLNRVNGKLYTKEQETPAPPKTCEHCKHWFDAHHKNVGICTNKKAQSMSTDEMHPVADFGCNQWKQR